MMKNTVPVNFFLLRGLAREIRHWGDFPHKLHKAAAGLEVTPLEIPGAGVLRKMRAPTNIDGHVDGIRQQYLHHSQAGTNVLIGLSLGGMIAAQWIHAHPTDFQAAVIINSSSSHSRFWQRMIPSGGRALLKAFSTRDIHKRERTIAGLITNLADADIIAHNWAEISRSAPISILNTFRQLSAAATFSLPRNSNVPTLVLCSTHDRLVSPICSADIARALNCGIVHHPLAGHDLTTDDPDWCITQIFSWLSALDS